MLFCRVSPPGYISGKGELCFTIPQHYIEIHLPHKSFPKNYTYCGGEDESCILANVSKRTKMGQCAAGIFLIWTRLDVKPTKTLKVQPLCRPRWCLVKALPKEMMTTSKAGIWSSCHPPASLLATRLKNNYTSFKRKANQKAGNFPPVTFFYTYT